MTKKGLNVRYRKDRGISSKFEVSPKIYVLRYDERITGSDDLAQVELAITRSEGKIYKRIGDCIFFGFPGTPGPESIKIVQMLKLYRYGSISASTLGHMRFKRILSAPWEYVDGDDLSNALLCGVQFNSVPSVALSASSRGGMRPLQDSRRGDDGSGESRPLTVEELDAFFPPLPEDDPLYTSGWIVGQTFAGATPSDARRMKVATDAPSSPRRLTEEEIQAELKRMREAGYGTMEISFAEEALRGLESKPQGNA